MKSRVQPTAYARTRGALAFSGITTAEGAETGWWWLRSPGYIQSFAASVNNSGNLNGYAVPDDEKGSVRPAFWLDLNADIF